MARDRNTVSPINPWPKVAWALVAGVAVISIGLGFGVLSRYQQNDPTLDLWSAICRGLGLNADIAPAKESEPALRTPSRIAWTTHTLDQVSAGDVRHGSFIAMNCVACHGQNGLSKSTVAPTLAGMDAAAIFKQLDDFRFGKRTSGVMEAIAKTLSVRDSADVAAYLAAQKDRLPPLPPARIPESGHGPRESDPAKRLVYAGDPRRGIAPCSSCHGPGGYKLGAPALHGQQAAYIERQLASFAQGLRQNDIFEQMRVIARQLTTDEMQALAAFYAGALQSPPTTHAGAHEDAP
ncbi:c-type cytochrome [Bradyrhizobium tropiciagri]|uniref:c-type cytochrome n=1 Tax=Bradyrhizobium tropiciagri TaxID=312253 RepID=UPI00067B9EFB|nr:c-type cytochrome [Bradyrhizobium tropiciagri]